MKYNIIGDIHGRTVWKELIIEGAVNIFVGDYFSPYHREITWQQQLDNFLQIIEYKQEHMNSTVLLVGNHDEDHWHDFNNGCSRHNYTHGRQIQELFDTYKDYFTAAYSIENKILVTHAGVSSVWYNRRVLKGESIKDMEMGDRHNLNPDTAADAINKLWKNNPVINFDFEHNCTYGDYCGDSYNQGPMWIRMPSLKWTNIFRGTDYIQVFGHTISEDIVYMEDVPRETVEHEGETVSIPFYPGTGVMYMVDCLEYKKESLLVEMNEGKLDKISHHTIE